ncbi:MAG TPA: hypothetical protein GXZ32_05295 [Clostridiales bacterium]|nr:hypothetical protein [Clostridiales bacterium]
MRIRVGRLVLTIFLVVVLIFLGYKFLWRKDTYLGGQIIRTNDISEVRYFYYHAVPGLKRAQDMGLVSMINKSLPIGDTSGKLNIDMIWYDGNNVFIFYNIEGLNRYGILGGDILPQDGSAGQKTTQFRGCLSPPGQKTRGIIYDDKFYSVIAVPYPLDDAGEDVEQLSEITYRPYLTLKEYNRPFVIDDEDEGYSFEPVRLQVDYDKEKYKAEVVKVEEQIDLEEGIFKIYQMEFGLTENRLYFLSNTEDIIYGIKALISTDRNETRQIDASTHIVSEYPYHYYASFPAFNELPGSVNISIEQIKLVSGEGVDFTIDTFDLDKDKEKSFDELIATVKNTNVYLDSIVKDERGLGVYMRYEMDGRFEKPYSRLQPEVPTSMDQWEYQSGIQGSSLPCPNMFKVVNDTGVVAKTGDFGDRGIDKEGMYMFISRDYIDSSHNIKVSIENMSYCIEVDQEIKLDFY